jgi:hypothetical protein
MAIQRRADTKSAFRIKIKRLLSLQAALIPAFSKYLLTHLNGPILRINTLAQLDCNQFNLVLHQFQQTQLFSSTQKQYNKPKALQTFSGDHKTDHYGPHQLHPSNRVAIRASIFYREMLKIEPSTGINILLCAFSSVGADLLVLRTILLDNIDFRNLDYSANLGI